MRALLPNCLVRALTSAATIFFATSVASAALLTPSFPNPPNLASNIPAQLALTWTPGDSDLIINGGFESGNFTGWTRFNDGNGALNNTYINNGTYVPQDRDGPFPPYAGVYSAVTDQNGPGLISIYQDVALPSSASSIMLVWADRIRNQYTTFIPTVPRQEYRVEIRSTTDAVLATAYQTEPGDPTHTDWTKRSFDLTFLKGQTVRIAFIEEQNWNFFNLHLDNVSIRVRDNTPITYTVQFATTNLLSTNDVVGVTSNGSWALPQLDPQKTYFWRVTARQGGNQIVGPVWRFTTAAVGPVDHFSWSNVPSSQAQGAPFSVTLRAQDSANNLVTNFNGPVDLRADSVLTESSGTILNNVDSTAFVAYERSTVGYSFAPTSDLLVTALRGFSGRKVSVWTDTGILLSSATLANGGASASASQSWTETAISPLQLYAGRTYRIGLYSPGLETNYMRLDGSSSFAHGIINQGFDGVGDAFPTNQHPARWWLVDLAYSARTLSPVTLTPATISSFSNGTWTGALTVSNALGPVVLRASDGFGHVGLSSPISFISDTDGDGMPDDWETAYHLNPFDPGDAALDKDGDGSTNLAEYLAGTDPENAGSVLRIDSIRLDQGQAHITFRSIPGRSYRLETASSVNGTWQTMLDNITATGASKELVISPPAGSVKIFYRLRLQP